MSALAIPKAYSIAANNKALCRRIGIRFDGVDRFDVHAYDSVQGWIRLRDGTVLSGRVEPYWRRVDA